MAGSDRFGGNAIWTGGDRAHRLTARSGQLVKAFLGNWKSYLLIGFVGFTIYPVLIFTGLTFTSAMNASVIMALSPVMTMVGAALFLGERLTARAGLGLAISVIGAVIAVLGDSPKGLQGSHSI